MNLCGAHLLHGQDRFSSEPIAGLTHCGAVELKAWPHFMQELHSLNCVWDYRFSWLVLTSRTPRLPHWQSAAAYRFSLPVRQAFVMRSSHCSIRGKIHAGVGTHQPPARAPRLRPGNLTPAGRRRHQPGQDLCPGHRRTLAGTLPSGQPPTL